MKMRARTLAVWAALLVAGAAGYTVDCNHEYTDCDTELSKMTDDEELPTLKTSAPLVISTSLPPTMTPEPKSTEKITEMTTETAIVHTEAPEEVKPQPRLLNLNVDELQNFANALHNQTDKSSKKLTDLSDVTIDDDEEEVPKTNENQHNKDIADKFYSNLEAPFHSLMSGKSESSEIEMCKENGVGYKIGDKIDRACDETCECTASGIFECSPRCKHPYIRRGRRLNDPLCFESPVDSCCSIIACATGNGDSKLSKLEVCKYNNETYTVGMRWYNGCESTCYCEPHSIVTCKPRCKPLSPSDKCINVQDPSDACCEVQVCDVSQDAHELTENGTTSTTASTPQGATEAEEEEERVSIKRPLVLTEPIGSIKVLQNNSVQVNLMHPNNSVDPIHLLLSEDGGNNFKDVELKYSNLILNLEGGKDYILKTKETGTKFNFTITAFDNGKVNEVEEKQNVSKEGCWQDGKFYEVGEEFRIGCKELCECTGPDTHECVALVCPNHVGLEIMSKGCVKWAPSPPAQPPNCCPRSARCLSDGTCHFNGVPVPNWSEVPISLTGCEQRCFCENGDLDCQEVCTPLPSVPPQTFRCPPLHRPAPVNISDEDCCKRWGCVPIGHTPQMSPNFPPQKHQIPSFLPTIPPEHYHEDDDYDPTGIHQPSPPEQSDLPGFPPGLPGLPPGVQLPSSFGDMNKKLTVITIESDSTTSIKMLLGLPPALVGLRGSVDLRYTDKADADVSHWYSQVFAPADEVLTTPRLEFRLTGLMPGTTYKVRGKLYLHNLPVSPESDTYSVRTQDLASVGPVEEKRREVNSGLTAVDVNDTTAHVSWKHFNEEELQFIDGIQVRYRPVGTPIYSMTELLHHSRSTAELHDLRPGSRYEASLVLIPPPRATTELHDPGRIEFTTAPYIDPYNWTVQIEVRSVGAEAAELTWRGVPSPAERWVRVYRAAHACGDQAGKEHDEFRLAARDQPLSVTLTGLVPDTRCRVWLELFLTNGKVKTSNVLEINTKTLDTDNPIDNEIEASGQSGSARGRPRGDYYTALVSVGVVAALGAFTSLLLLLVVVRRHRPRSVPITPVPSAPRESSLPPYDNPAYKLELQQETMDL